MELLGFQTEIALDLARIDGNSTEIFRGRRAPTADLLTLLHMLEACGAVSWSPIFKTMLQESGHKNASTARRWRHFIVNSTIVGWLLV